MQVYTHRHMQFHDESLQKKTTMLTYELFSNTAYGVEVVKNLGSTTVLKSVVYIN